jgi:transmembrane sensor
MTGQLPIAEARESAHDVRLQAARWLQRRQLWDWSAEDQAELDRWLARSPSHHVAYMRVMAVWNRTERLTALRGASAPEGASTRRHGWSLILRSAAAIALVSAVGLAGFRYLQIRHQTIWTTPVGGHEILKLADGSKIELNTNTVVRVSADQRSAWLDRGEAYFQIRHDSAHPFSVTVADKRVVDIGTKFLVRDDSADLEVALIEGKAKIEPVKPQAKIRTAVLTRGDVALATGNSLSIVKVPQAALLRELSWRQDLLVFDNATLADVAAELNRYNREQLVIDPTVAGVKVVASIPTNGIQAFKRVARDFLGLRVEERGNDIVISR